MDQNKNTQGQQGQGSTPTRDQAEGSRDQTRSGGSSGISNRGMSSSDEQEDLPSRGSIDDDSFDQSER
jgi:hypothetical protein